MVKCLNWMVSVNYLRDGIIVSLVHEPFQALSMMIMDTLTIQSQQLIMIIIQHVKNIQKGQIGRYTIALLISNTCQNAANLVKASTLGVGLVTKLLILVLTKAFLWVSIQHTNMFMYLGNAHFVMYLK